MRTIIIMLLLALLQLTLPLPAAAAGPGDEPPDYDSCMQAARSDPEAALEAALTWRDLGGGGAAEHCAAVAMIGLGQFARAAERLEVLSKAPSGIPAGQRAELLAQAGQAWLQAGDPARANASQTAALALAEDGPAAREIRIDRSMSLAAAGNYWQAIDDLNAVIEDDPENVTAHVLRASAYRFVDALDLAREDAEYALTYSPHHPEGLLEYGNILRLQGDEAGARRAWAMLVRLHEGRPAADAAQRNLEMLDVKTEPAAPAR